MRLNSLLPIPPRIRVAHHSDVRVGVHTTVNIDRSTWYAVSAAATNDPSDEPNVGIILEIDASGLVPVPDYDALYLQETLGGIAEQELLGEEEALLAIEEGDGEILIDLAQNLVEDGEYCWEDPIENWNDALPLDGCLWAFGRRKSRLLVTGVVSEGFSSPENPLSKLPSASFERKRATKVRSSLSSSPPPCILDMFLANIVRRSTGKRRGLFG